METADLADLLTALHCSYFHPTQPLCSFVVFCAWFDTVFPRPHNNSEIIRVVAAARKQHAREIAAWKVRNLQQAAEANIAAISAKHHTSTSSVAAGVAATSSSPRDDAAGPSEGADPSGGASPDEGGRDARREDETHEQIDSKSRVATRAIVEPESLSLAVARVHEQAAAREAAGGGELNAGSEAASVEAVSISPPRTIARHRGERKAEASSEETDPRPPPQHWKPTPEEQLEQV